VIRPAAGASAYCCLPCAVQLFLFLLISLTVEIFCSVGDGSVVGIVAVVGSPFMSPLPLPVPATPLVAAGVVAGGREFSGGTRKRS
jgi:hypothetical protein